MARPPTGRRVKLTIPSGIGQQVAASAAMRLQVERVTNDIADLADHLVPIGSEDDLHPDWPPGVLKDSQVVGVYGSPAEGWVGLVGYAAYWAHMMHWGTASMRANPWLQNALLAATHR